MFQYNTDIAVLHGAFIFIDKYKLNDSEAVESILKLLEKSVQIKNEIQIKRMNAALFVSLISPKEIENHSFEAINGLFLNCNWKIYFNLIEKAFWGPHFLECCSNIDQVILKSILHKALHYSESDKCYLINCVIQTILNRSQPETFLEILETCFQKLQGNFITTTNKQDLQSLLETLAVLCDQILTQISTHCVTLETQRLKIVDSWLLHWSKLIHLIYAILKDTNIENYCCETLFTLLRYLRMNYINLEQLNEFKQLEKIASKLKNDQIELNSLSEISNCFTSINNLLLKPANLNESFENCDENRYNFEVTLASQILFEQMEKLLSICLANEDLENKNTLSRLFLQIATLPLNKISDEQKMFLILDYCGLEAGPIKEQDYQEKLVLFLNRALETDFEKSLLLLCLQSPAETVDNLLQQAIENGGRISLVVNMLNYLSPICLHLNATDQLSQLVSNIIYVIKNQNLSKTQRDNLAKCIQLLSKEFPKSALNLPELLKHLFGKFEPNMSQNISELILDITIQILNSDDDSTTLISKCVTHYYPIEVIVTQLLQVANYFIQNGGNNIREKTTKILWRLKLIITKDEIILSDATEIWIRNQLSECHELIQLEAAMFFNYELWTDSDTVHQRLLEACFYDHRFTTFLKFDRTVSIISLAKILPYSTAEESLKMVKSLLNLVAENNLKDETEIQLQATVVELYIDSLILLTLSQIDVLNWNSILTAYGYVVKFFIETTNNLTTLFNETCRLAQDLPMTKNLQDTVVNILLQIDNQLNEKTFVNNCVQALPKNELKITLLEMLC